MDIQSPLTQQARPEVFKPKVVGLYEELFHVGSRICVTTSSWLTAAFQDEHFDNSDGFWRSLFLLRPDQQALKNILLRLSADDLLYRHVRATVNTTSGDGH